MGLVRIEDLLNQPREMVAKYMSYASDIGEMYEQFVKTDDEDVSFIAGWHGANSRSGGIHASELSGACRRPVWYSLMGVQRQDGELDPFWKKRFRAGHLYHAMIQEDFRRMCEKSGGLMSFEKEARIAPELQTIAAQYDIQSSADGVIVFRDRPWGEAILRLGLEIKTDSPDVFKERKEPESYHLRQTCVYMRCLDLPVMWTMYINKGNQNIVPSKAPYLFAFDFKLWGELEQETKEVIHLATIKEIPPAKEGMPCEFCGYAWQCQPDYLKAKAARDKGKKERRARQDRMKRVGTGGIRVPKVLP